MGTDVYVKHGLRIRRIDLGSGIGAGFEIHADGATLTLDEFIDMTCDLLQHLMKRQV